MTEQQRLAELEREARASLEAAYGHPLSDEEWNEARAHLLLLARSVRDTLRDAKEEERAA